MSTKSTRTRKTTTPAPQAKGTAVPATKPAPRNCGCGCGAPTVTSKATFLAGHDARHAGNIGRALAANPNDAQAKAARDSATPKLQAKIDKVRATAEGKAAVKAARETAKVAYEKALAEALGK